MGDKDALFEAAVRVRENAYAPYSGYQVGAVLVAADGSFHTGCNVENVAFPEGTCAEAGAISAMCAAGNSREIRAVLVVAGGDVPVSPCGGCRQRLAEFGAADVPVYLATLDGIRQTTTLGALLPGAFSNDHVQGTYSK